MTLFCILCTLAFEQFQAAPAVRIQALMASYADFLERQFNGGEYRHGAAAWGVGVLMPVLLLSAAGYAIGSASSILGMVFAVALLYLMVGFRQFSHYFTDIQIALRMEELERARSLLAEWRGCGSGERLGSAEIARLAIEQGILSSHRLVFAPLCWFIVLGPAGAVLYRLALFMTQRWPEAEANTVHPDDFGRFARRAFWIIDWIPTRLTAVTFAIVGDFEDAVFCWRSQAEQWPDDSSGILLSSGAGAMGVRLGQPLPDEAGIDVRPELGIGEDADVEHLQSAIGLVWRALVLSLLVLALLTVASWVGA